jgi:hypothetical protein
MIRDESGLTTEPGTARGATRSVRATAQGDENRQGSKKAHTDVTA